MTMNAEERLAGQSGPVVEEEETKEESDSSSPQESQVQEQKEGEVAAADDENNDNNDKNDNNNIQTNPESSAADASAESSNEDDDEKEDEEEEPCCGSIIRDGIIEFSVEPIKNQLLCSLCEGLYKEPYRTMKCHHTFCKSCLRIGLQSCLGTPEHNCCPSCKTYLGGKSDLATVAVPDRVLETIIDKIFFPEIAQADAQAEIDFYQKRGIPLKQPSITANEDDMSVNDGEDDNNNDGLDSSAFSMGRGRKKRKRQRRSVADSSDDDAFDSTTMGTKIMFHLLPEENSANDAPPPLESPFLRTDGSIRIGQLKKYIRNTMIEQQQRTDPELSPKQQNHHHPDGDEEDEEEEDVAPNTTNTTPRTRAMDASEERAVALLIEFHRAPERRPADRDLEILCNSIPLGNELSVNFVWRTVWIDHSKKLTLYYRYADAKR